MTYIIIDFEATCSDTGEFPREEMEIIEWGAAAVDKETLRTVSDFGRFVKPVRNPILTRFCKELTSITQEDVDNGMSFSSSLSDFVGWMNQFKEVTFCSWGNYDKNQLLKDCEFHGVKYPFNDEHINIKKVFTDNNGITKKKGLLKSLQRVGLEFEGTQHRGIDDVKNMIKLLPYIFGEERITSGRS
jgi:inhibitor of KinA sporulation pathway (predicted exonuclease)